MAKALRIGGFVAGAILIVFGVIVIALAINGRSTVTSSLKDEKIVGSPDMNPSDIEAAMKEAGLTGVDVPSCDVANEEINTGSEARCFAEYMRIHALEASGGLTYAEMGRYATENGDAKGTNDAEQAAKDDKGQPVSNSARNLWVTETALSTALNVSYMAEQLALFSLVVGIALLLAGVGFIVLAYAAMRPPQPEWPPSPSRHERASPATAPATLVAAGLNCCDTARPAGQLSPALERLARNVPDDALVARAAQQRNRLRAQCSAAADQPVADRIEHGDEKRPQRGRVVGVLEGERDAQLDHRHNGDRDAPRQAEAEHVVTKATEDRYEQREDKREGQHEDPDQRRHRLDTDEPHPTVAPVHHLSEVNVEHLPLTPGPALSLRPQGREV